MENFLPEEKIEEALADIEAVLQKHNLVLTSHDEMGSSVRMRMRWREENEVMEKPFVFGRDIWLGKADMLSKKEREIYDAWQEYYRAWQKDNWPPLRFRKLPRADSVELGWVTGFYDGPLSGICHIQGEAHYYAALVENEDTFGTPRAYAAYRLPAKIEKIALEQTQLLLTSGWKHLVMVGGKRVGEYEGGEYPAHPQKEAVTEFGKEMHQSFLENKTQPDFWFSRTDAGSQEREEEMEYCFELMIDNKLEIWDCGSKIEPPPIIENGR